MTLKIIIKTGFQRITENEVNFNIKFGYSKISMSAFMPEKLWIQNLHENKVFLIIYATIVLLYLKKIVAFIHSEFTQYSDINNIIQIAKH